MMRRPTIPEGRRQKSRRGRGVGDEPLAAGERSILTRVLSTPIFEFGRGRGGPRADADEILRRADLPSSLAATVSRVVRRSALWRGERADVAGELCAHFLDGLEAGRTPEQLREDFGDPRAAARLIRRAKRRARPLVWQAWAALWRVIGWGLLVLLGVYVFLLVRYVLLEPTISHNYSAEFNARFAGIPASERAWPQHRAAFLMLTPVGDGSIESFSLPPDADERLPDYPTALRDQFARWDVPEDALGQVRDYLTLNAPALERIRAAAGVPSLGLELTDATDVEVMRHSFAMGLIPEYDLSDARTTPSRNPSLIGVLLPDLSPLRFISRLLASDARLACIDGDADRFEADALAMLGIGEQLHQHRLLIGDLVSIAVVGRALDTIDHALARSPGLLRDDQIARLAHRLSRVGAQGPLVTFDGERAMFQDMLQRVYSDDGNGNGVPTREGIKSLGAIMSDFGPVPPDSANLGLVGDALGPISAAVMADRKDMRGVYEQYMSAAERLARTPLWERDGAISPDVMLERHHHNPLWQARYLLVSLLMPALEHASLSGEYLLQRRDATLVALAVELHRRRAGGYPTSLDEISTSILPAVPRDRFTGDPIGYVLRDGCPTIYSRGVDRDDDSGHAPADLSNRHDGYRRPERVDQWLPAASVQTLLADPTRSPAFDGDWILYPPQSDSE